MDISRAQVTRLMQEFGDGILSVQMPIEDATDVPILTVRKESVLRMLEFLRSQPGFEYTFLADITATDEQGQEPRFRVVYQLYSPEKHCRIRVKVPVREGESVPSATKLWAGANWAEREVWDMFGIPFSEHPDLRRILMDERWEGHPLRKDYPLRGYQIFDSTEPVHPELLK